MPVKLDANPTGVVELTPIPIQEIQKMRDNYKAGLPPGSTDAVSGWVARSEIEALLRDNESPGIIPNGIRFYYGRHVDSTMGSIGYEYKGKHTIILVATYDSNVADPQTEYSTDLLNDGTGDEPVNSVVYTSSYQGMGGDAIPLCPPRC